MSEPIVAIVGAPNVGKSTLFNRLSGGRPAIVSREPGTTRDRLYLRVDEPPVPFRIVDTGGLSWNGDSTLERGIDSQVHAALSEASVVLLVVDAQSGLTALDERIAGMLRRRSLSVLLVANKVDVPSHEALASEFFALGLGEPIPVSAAHGEGIGTLLGEIGVLLVSRPLRESPVGESESAEPAVRVALVGRPNVGKSSLANELVGSERHLVGDLPGTTRDAVDETVVHEGRRYILVDTAGLRRRGKAHAETESMAMLKARSSIRRADVVVLVLDASAEPTAQDAHVGGYVQEAYRPLIIVGNKWDLVEDREESAKRWTLEVRSRLPFAPNAPILLTSAKTGQRVARIFDLVDRVHAAAGTRIATPELNRWLRSIAEDERSAPAFGRSVRLLYMTQVGVHPPRFVLFCNDPARVHFSLRRRIENSLRERFDFGPSPLRLQFRGRRGERVAR